MLEKPCSTDRAVLGTWQEPSATALGPWSLVWERGSSSKKGGHGMSRESASLKTSRVLPQPSILTRLVQVSRQGLGTVGTRRYL